MPSLSPVLFLRNGFLHCCWKRRLGYFHRNSPDSRLPINPDLNDTQKTVTDEKNIPGIVLGVANVDQEIYFQGGGYHRFGDSSSGEINPESVFWICSQTKMIAAVSDP